MSEVVEVEIASPSQKQRWGWHWTQHIGAIAISLALALLALHLFVQNNDFPVGYHPDEVGKAMQLRSPDQFRNFHHPLMMLEAANLFRKAEHTPSDTRSILLMGRNLSALLSAFAVFCMAMAAYAGLGFAGLLVVGAAIALCPPLLVYAHYFKEDTSLIAGVALATLGAAWLLRARRWRWQILASIVMGLGCAAAVSGKMVGAAAIVPSLAAICLAPNPRNAAGSFARRFSIFGAAVAVRTILLLLVAASTTVAINARAFDNYLPPRISSFAWDEWIHEYEHGTTGHGDLALTHPNTFVLRTTFDELTLDAWLLGGIGWLYFAWRRRVTRWGLFLAGSVATWGAVLSFDAIPFARYALPLVILVYFSLVLWGFSALNDLAHRTHQRWARIAAPLACALLIALVQGQRCANFTQQFRDDSRQRLRNWVNANLPPGATIAVDSYTDLESGGDPWRFPDQPQLHVRVVGSQFASSFSNSMDGLARQGFRYVAVASTNYDRFFVPDVHALPGSEREFNRERNFYADLFQHKEDLIWISTPHPPTDAYVNPEIRVYRIPR